MVSFRSHMSIASSLLVLICMGGLGRQQSPQLDGPAYNVKVHYTKREYMIPMRDDIKLFTIVYSPKDASQKYPILISRTAYGIPPYGPNEYKSVIDPNNDFAKEGYIVVYQDTRGKFKSEGEFIHHRPILKGPNQTNESTDTYDTID